MKNQAPARQDKIIEAAIACFIRKGFHATSMRDIAKQANVSLGNLYTYFPGKQQLIAEVAELERQGLAPILQSLDEIVSPRIEDVVRILTEYRALNLQPEWAILSAECLAELTRTSVLRSAFAENRVLLLNTFASAIERGADTGSLRPAAEPLAIAQLLLDGVEAEALRHAIADEESSSSAVISSPLLRCLLLA
ncbi:TetR/AcrR family transcriptional regulator [Pseudoduganella sp. SL102]|uniref:TetR/AcrR family transcriptional regulator n=1 Tax=Pseudoduganella sp. SL102 TaxID=2995154 RepID=UPI00248B8C8F|nr:TetR/AcrR family transcriptional regulator [Pseudoduganella sp. SL102]WBR99934.1 TetR/AcrR family transcriptional regulator [Pseudoduganella sp. SL102]